MNSIFDNRVQQYFAAAAVMLIYLDRDQNIIQINKKGCEILEYTESEMIGKNWFDNFFPQKNIAEVKELFEKFVSGEKGSVECYEKSILTKSGTEKIISWHNSIIKDDFGHIIGILSSGEDITEQKQIVDALKRSEERYRVLAEKYLSIFQTVPVSIVMADKNGQINDVNQYHLDQIARNRVNKEHYLQYKLWEHPSVKAARSELKSEFRRVFKGKSINLKGVYFPVTMGRRDRFLDVRGVPLFKDNKVDGAIIIHEDVTEHYLTKKDLQYQVETNQVLMTIAFDSINVPLDKVDNAIHLALEKIGKLIAADRGYLFKYDFNSMIAVNTHEWCSQGVEPQIENLQSSPMEAAPEWIEAHQKGEPLIVQDVSALPFGRMRDILESQKIKSLITIPLFQKSRLTGFLGFDFVHGCQTELEKNIKLVKFLGEILINLNQHVRAEERLICLNAILEQKVEKRTRELKILNEHLIYVEEKERSNIASDLHDTVSQNLALSVSKIKNIKESDNADSRAVLSDIQKLIEQSLEDIRLLIYQLCPPVLKDFDIATAIAFLIDEINGKFNASIKYINHFDSVIDMEEPLKITLYRAANELVLNILKHAGVKKGLIELSNNQDTILLKVEDRGVGFDIATLNKNHFNGFGLFALSERCKNMGGIFQIESTPGEFTKVLLYMPFN